MTSLSAPTPKAQEVLFKLNHNVSPTLPFPIPILAMTRETHRGVGARRALTESYICVCQCVQLCVHVCFSSVPRCECTHPALHSVHVYWCAQHYSHRYTEVHVMCTLLFTCVLNHTLSSVSGSVHSSVLVSIQRFC